MTNAPTFSFVATSRNDDHGGDVLRRTQSFVNRLAEQCNRHQLPCELVLVDWNPPAARAPLADVLAWPAGSEWFSARVVTVPPAVHRTIRYSSRLAMYQMIAKNVGIRRARGAYAIATNIDIIFSDELFRWLKSDLVQEGVLYRSDRWDIQNEIQLEPDIATLLRRARVESFRRNLRDGTYILRGGQFVNSSGNRFDALVYDPIRILTEQVRQSMSDANGHGLDDALRVTDDILSNLPRLRRDFLMPALHTNGCGDFTMLSQPDWAALRGYPEWHLFSWHIDSVIIFQAYYAGLRIEELGGSCVHYHIEHDYGSGWTPDGAESLWARLLAGGIPFISFAQFNQIVTEMQECRAQGLVKTYNAEDWGFAALDLEVQEIVGPDTPARPPRATNDGKLRDDLSLNLVAAAPGDLTDLVRPVGATRRRQVTPQQGAPEPVFETPPRTSDHALKCYRSRLPPAGEYWIRAEVVIEDGNIELGVHDRSNSGFLLRTRGNGPSPEPQALLLHIWEIAEAGDVVLMNATPDHRAARFRLRSLQLLQDGLPEAGAAAATDDSSDAWARARAIEVGQVNRSPARLADLKPASPRAIVRLLHDVEAGGGQAMIILPPAGAAALELGPSAAADGIALRLHVIDGEVLVALQGPAGETIAEHREAQGEPFVRVDFPPRPSDVCSLVIRNATVDGRTTVLVHALEHPTGAAAGAAD